MTLSHIAEYNNTMKKYIKLNFIILIFIVLISATIIFVACERNEASSMTKHPDYIASYTINYLYPDIGGYYIDGDRNQHVKPGCDGKEVTVKAFEGFRFVEWSDGVKTISRRETNVQSSMELTPIFARIELSVKFNAEEGGYIEGETNQTVLYGDSSIEVKAIPDENHLFADWSDGIMTETRTFTETKENSEINALFVSKTKTMRYDFDIPSVYHNEITLTHGNLDATKFYIPEKQGYIFDGWYINKELTKKVTDGRGYYFRGNTIFHDESNILYPKWITELNKTFKILIVFTETIDAVLPTIDNVLIDIDYKMPFAQRRVCDLIPDEISTILNKWLDGKVKFEVDTFYTTKPILTEYFNSIEPGWDPEQRPDNNHFIDANYIPEVFPVLQDYRSILTSINMNDANHLLHQAAGLGIEKYACIYLDDRIDYLALFADVSNLQIWHSLIRTYLHEFSHTIEGVGSGIGVHDVISYYWNILDNIESIRRFLTKEALIDGEYVGMNLDYWQGNIGVTISYHPTSFGGNDNGKIIILNDEGVNQRNHIYKTVPFGSDITVQAIPFEGWRFVKWSDGVTTATRHDINLISKLKSFAIFEKI